MMKSLLDFFRPPAYSHDAQSRTAYYLHVLTLAGMVFISMLVGVRLLTGEGLFSVANAVFLGVLLILALAFGMLKSGYSEFAGYLVVFSLWASATLLAIGGNGSPGTQAARYVVIVFLAGLVIGNRAAIWSALASLLAMAGVMYLYQIGAIIQEPEPPPVAFVQAAVPLILSVTLIHLSVSSLQRAFKQEKEHAQSADRANLELRETKTALEREIREKNAALEKATLEAQRRATQFQTISQLTQKVAQERDLERLLAAAAEIIGAQFNYHHVAIYLNDETQEFAILSAANSEEGRRMMESGFKLPINLSNLIGYAAKTGKAQSDAERPEQARSGGARLANTHWEYAVPLITGSQAIGVLDAQSETAKAPDPAELEALLALASQITIAIQNARLFAETQTALAESRMLYGAVVKQTWKTSIQSRPQIGYRYAGLRAAPLQKEVDSAEIREALETASPAVTPPARRPRENAIAVPLKLRESVIGVINVKFPLDMEVGEDEQDVILAASERIALALENASLLEESQRRARREQTIGEISSKISAGMEVETILKTVVEELGSRVSSAQISIELGSDENAL